MTCKYKNISKFLLSSLIVTKVFGAEQPEDYLTHLPKELINEVCKHLTLQGTINLGSTNKKNHKLLLGDRHEKLETVSCFIQDRKEVEPYIEQIISKYDFFL